MCSTNDAEDVIAAFGDAIGHDNVRRLLSGEQRLTSESRVERRFVATVTATLEDCLSPIAYVFASQPAVSERWLVESLLPVPLLSVPAGGTADLCVKSLLSMTREFEGRVRVICGADYVTHGQQGSPTRFAYGSVGSVVSDVVRACGLLPLQGSWIDDGVRQTYEEECSSWRMIGSRRFWNCIGVP